MNGPDLSFYSRTMEYSFGEQELFHTESSDNNASWESI